MAIELERTAQLWGITGNLGGGKSLTAVWFAVRAIRQGYFVCTNITLNVSVLERLVGSWAVNLYQHISFDDPDFDPFKLPCGSPRGSRGDKRVLVILDECAEWIDQYSSAKDPRIARFWSWLRHSSKRSQDVFIVVQRPDYLNKVVRILISRWVMVADLATYRIPVLRLRFPFMSGYVMRNVYDRSGTRIGGVSFISKSTWGVFYDTAECLNSLGAQYNTQYSMPRRPKGRSWLFFVILYALSLVALYNARERLIVHLGGRQRQVVNTLSNGSVEESKRNKPLGKLFATCLVVGGLRGCAALQFLTFAHLPCGTRRASTARQMRFREFVLAAQTRGVWASSIIAQCVHMRICHVHES